ncbi:MAG: hypothetical protein B6I38_09375 [Anaerolineaceae bacterium 4572_5.1]|nr:MAG: hypothetical protein B5M51_08595 [Anaerolinea sp. 4484_236]OQY28251.1 MAG: hypothetical protein B6I38_09375 [Anaerolineaceae bacterium 4572_5.1]RLD11655.1 MAG: hypothetical protein DRI56_00630 [Chloroflexota bacterium]
MSNLLNNPPSPQRIFFYIILAFAVSACNLPSSTPASSPKEKLIGTSVAQTMEAVKAQPPTATNAPTHTPTKLPPTLTATITLTTTPTPTYALPILSFEGDTNCRSGPGLNYEIIGTYIEGEKAEILGRHPSEDFWVVKAPYGEGDCWVVGDYASASGSYLVVPTMTPPPTNTPSPPIAPTLQEYNYACNWDGSQTNMTMTMVWSDWADNEDGYRIYRNGVLIIDLSANTTTYVDVVAVNLTQTITYGIEAYNSSGVSGQATFSASCQ